MTAVSAEYSSLFRAGLSPRTNVFDPSDLEVQDAEHRRLTIFTKYASSPLRRLSHVFAPVTNASPRRGHRPHLSLDTRFSQPPVHAEDSFLSFSATADTYALPSSSTISTQAAPRRRTEPSLPLISRFSPDTPDDDVGYSALWMTTPATAVSPLARGHRAPPSTPNPHSTTVRTPISPPTFTTPFAAEDSPLPTPLETPPTTTRRHGTSHIWEHHPFGIGIEERARRASVHPYASSF